MLRIITLNLNGIRSALAKGFPRWLARQRADLVCLQEIKAQEGDLADLTLIPRGYHGHYHCCSTKRGWSASSPGMPAMVRRPAARSPPGAWTCYARTRASTRIR